MGPGLRRWRCLIFLLGCPGILGAAGEPLPFTQYSRSENVRIRCGHSGDLPALFQITCTCSAETRKWLGCHERPRTRLDIHFIGDAAGLKTPGPSGHRLQVLASASPEEIYFRLISAFLGRFVEERCRGRNRNPGCLPWMGAGLYHRIYYDGKGFILGYRPDFRIAREQFDRGFYPDLERLLLHPVPRDRTCLYRLYALYCDVFLKTLETRDRRDQPLLRRFLEFQSFDRPQLPSLRLVLRDELGGEDLESWYRRQMYRQSGEGVRKAQAETISARLKEIVTVPFIAEDRPGEVTGLPIPCLDSRRLTRRFLDARRVELEKLHLRAPALLQPPIVLFVRMLACRTRLGMRRSYRRAEKEFREACRRQLAAERMMEQYERTAAGTTGGFVDDWEIIRRHQDLRRELLSEALDLPEE